jgi:hypothetical protein
MSFSKAESKVIISHKANKKTKILLTDKENHSEILESLKYKDDCIPNQLASTHLHPQTPYTQY